MACTIEDKYFHILLNMGTKGLVGTVDTLLTTVPVTTGAKPPIQLY
jgi:hypothetical protein